MIEQTYFLDMIPGESTPPVVHVSQFDVNSRTLTFNLMKGGVAFAPDAGMSVTLDGMKPDNHVFSYPMTVNGSSVSIDVLTQMTVVSGHVRCEVSVSNQNGKIGSANFILAVEESPIDSGSISESDIPIFEDLKNQAQQAAADAEQSASDAEGFAADAETAATSVSAMMATVESTTTASKAYSVGDYLVLNGKLYEVTTAIARGGTLTVGTNISETTAGSELTSLNSNLNQKVSSVNDIQPDTNGNVALNAEDIPAEGVGPKDESGNPIIVTDAVAENAQNLSVELEPIQSGSGDPSPTNIRPITGRTQVDVTRTGKNLWGGEKLANDILRLVSNSSIDQVNNSVFFSARNVANVELFSNFKANTQYTFILKGINGASSSTDTNLAVTYTDGTSAYLNFATAGVESYCFFTTANNKSVKSLRGVWKTTDTTLYYNECGIFEGVLTEADFEPYTEQSVTVQLGQTVYGGTLNVTTGELTVETANIASYNGETIGEPWWSSMDEYVAGATPTTGAQVVYTLATPTTVSLTPTQLALLEGYNILTTDGNNINLRYTGTVASNVQSEIDEFEESTRTLAGSLAMIETSPATANHAVGSYLMLNNRLCKVTSAIATGEQIIVGSNVQYTTVAEELTAILAQINA